MAIQEYIDDSVDVASTKYVIIVNGTEISGQIEKGGYNVTTSGGVKIVVGTQSEINAYIADNNLTYEDLDLPEIDG